MMALPVLVTMLSMLCAAALLQHGHSIASTADGASPRGLAMGPSRTMAQAPAPGPASDFFQDAMAPAAEAPSIVNEQAPVAPPSAAGVLQKCCQGAVCEILTGPTAPFCQGRSVAVASTMQYNITLDSDACMTASSYLYIQMWLRGVTEEEIAASGGSPLMVLSQGLIPEVVWQTASEMPRFFPPLATAVEQIVTDEDLVTTSATATTLTPGSFSDVSAWLLSRRHHRIVVPIAAAASPEPYAELKSDKVTQDQWHLTVANMASWLYGDLAAASVSIAEKEYVLRADCLTTVNAVKCPIATGNADQCAGRNETACQTASGPLGPDTVRVCQCKDGWAGYACAVRARTLQLPEAGSGVGEGNTGWLQLSDLNNGSALETGQWAHLRVRLHSSQQLVVVEMEQQVGSCMLIAKPRGQGQAPYDVPSILNFNEFGDVEAYRDHSTHAAQSLLRVGEPQSHEIMVAVHNFVDAAIPSEPCQARLRVRSAPAESMQNMCPFDCSDGQGECGDLLTLQGGTESTTNAQIESMWISLDEQQQRCTCNMTGSSNILENAGRFCEADLLSVFDGNNAESLQPGSWRAHQYIIGDKLGTKLDGGWSEHGNIVFVASVFGAGDVETRAPTPTQHDFIFQSGPGQGGLKEFTILPEDLTDVQFIVFALYNIDQGADTAIEYMLRVQQKQEEQKLSAAIIVAIVIGGVVVLLFVLVLCMVIFKQCRARMQDPQVVLQHIGPRVVPPLDPKAIDELETFSFEDLPKKAAAMSARVLNPPTSETGGKGGNPPNPTMCRICHDDYSAADQLVRLPCGHIFHKRCARKWLGEETATCPVCRLNLLDPTLPARTAGSHTETSFSVPGNLTTPVHSDSAPSVVSSEQLDQEGARRSMTPGGMSSERSFRSTVAPPMHNGSTAAPSLGGTGAPAVDSPFSPSRSRSPLFRMFSGPTCGTERSGEGLSQEDLFHSMPADSNMSGILHSVASASAVAGVTGPSHDPGAWFGEHSFEGSNSTEGRMVPHGVGAVSVAGGAHTVLRDSDVQMAQFSHQHLQHGGGPIVVPAPPAVSPVVGGALGTVIPAPVGPIPTVPSSAVQSSANLFGSQTCVIGVPGASGAVSVSATHSGPSRAVSGVSGDFAGLPPVGVGFGTTGDLLSPLPGTNRVPEWAFMGGDRSEYMHERLVAQMHGHAHHRGAVDSGVLQNGELTADAGPMISWRPGHWSSAPVDTLVPPAGTAPPLPHSQAAASGTAGGYAHSTAAMHELADHHVHSQSRQPRLSDGAMSASAATGSGLGLGHAVSEDSLLNSDGGGTVAGDSGQDDGDLHTSVRSPRSGSTRLLQGEMSGNV